MAVSGLKATKNRIISPGKVLLFTVPIRYFPCSSSSLMFSSVFEKMFYVVS